MPKKKKMDPTNAETWFPSPYLALPDLEGREFTLTVERVELLEMFNNRAKANEVKPVLFLKGAEKGLVINKTKKNALIESLGPDTRKWKGAKVKLSPGRSQQKIDLTVVSGAGVKSMKEPEPEPEPPPDMDEEPLPELGDAAAE